MEVKEEDQLNGPNNSEMKVERKHKKSLINNENKFHFNEPKPVSIGIDVGGTLSKLSILVCKEFSINDKFISFIKDFNPDMQMPVLSGNNFELNNENCMLYVKRISTSLVDTDLIDFLLILKSFTNYSVLKVSGGGSYKYNSLFEKKLNVQVKKIDELQALLYGNAIMNEYNTMYYLENEKLENILISAKQDTFNDVYKVNYRKINSIHTFKFPHLVVNIGSGVSIVKVLDENTIERVGGTMCGGGTLIGLSKLILGIEDFDEILNLAKKGDHRNLDLLVSDIYGKSILVEDNMVKLENDVLASSFGKACQLLTQKEDQEFKKEDIAQSLLILICFQISQLAYLYSKQDNIKTVFYYGNFTRKDSFSIELLNFGTKFWDNSISSHFNDLDGLLGSIGSLSSKFDD